MTRQSNNCTSGEQNVFYDNPITLEQSGGPGRPRKKIALSYLREAFSEHRRITVTRVAETLGIHRNTLAIYMKLHGVSSNFTGMSDDDIDKMMREYRLIRPGSGIRYVIGHLHQNNIRLQRARVINSVHRVDQLGVIIRRQNRIQRRVYQVSRPNALWHCDGHHKLIRWGIVIHGFIDGYSRLVRYTFIIYFGITYSPVV